MFEQLCVCTTRERLPLRHRNRVEWVGIARHLICVLCALSVLSWQITDAHVNTVAPLTHCIVIRDCLRAHATTSKNAYSNIVRQNCTNHSEHNQECIMPGSRYPCSGSSLASNEMGIGFRFVSYEIWRGTARCHTAAPKHSKRLITVAAVTIIIQNTRRYGACNRSSLQIRARAHEG